MGVVARVTTPSGWKAFQDGQVLPANEINGYLQQGVLVFDNESARDAALVGFVREGMVAYSKASKEISSYNGTSWNRVTGSVEFASEAARNSAIPSPTDGRYAFTLDNLRLWKYSTSATAWREVGVNVSFATTAARDTAFPSPVNGQYVYITGILSTFFRTGGAWVKVGPDVETTKNFLGFSSSGSTTVPAWATKLYYLVIGGGNTGANAGAGDVPGGNGGNGGQVTQGSTTSISSGQSITITVGGAGANSSVALSGGSTFTGTGGGGASGGTTAGQVGANGTSLTGVFAIGTLGGGGGKGGGTGASNGAFGGNGGGGYGATICQTTDPTPQPFFVQARAGHPNTGGGGGGGAAGFNLSPTGNGAGATGGSGLVCLFFS
jgi:hypothetical protein